MEQTTATLTPPARGEIAACRGCGSPLDLDQRYCLACGARHGTTRVPVSALFAAPPAPAAAAPAVRAPDRPVVTPVIAAIGAMAVVLALVAGLLIGRGERPTAAAPAAAPTITVQGGGTATDQSASAADSTSSAKHKKKGKGARTPKAPKASLNAAGQKVGTADKATLNALQNTSGKDYSKKSANLPKTTVLPGKPPPKDNKPAGGGSGFQEIGG